MEWEHVQISLSFKCDICSANSGSYSDPQKSHKDRVGSQFGSNIFPNDYIGITALGRVWKGPVNVVTHAFSYLMLLRLSHGCVISNNMATE